MTSPESRAELIAAWNATETKIRALSRGTDVIIKGPAAFVVPALHANLHPAVLAAVRVRRTAILNGRCPECDGVADVGTEGSVTFAHERECVATDENVTGLLRRHPPPPNLGPRLDDE